jgi:hypothetical protein
MPISTVVPRCSRLVYCRVSVIVGDFAWPTYTMGEKCVFFVIADPTDAYSRVLVGGIWCEQPDYSEDDKLYSAVQYFKVLD